MCIRTSQAVASLDWTEPLPQSLRPDRHGSSRWDVLIATDVLYSRDVADALAATLTALAGARAGCVTECWIAAGRNRAAADVFFAAASREWAVRRVPAHALHPIYRPADVTVWRMRRRR